MLRSKPKLDLDLDGIIEGTEILSVQNEIFKNASIFNMHMHKHKPNSYEFKFNQKEYKRARDTNKMLKIQRDLAICWSTEKFIQEQTKITSKMLKCIKINPKESVKPQTFIKRMEKATANLEEIADRRREAMELLKELTDTITTSNDLSDDDDNDDSDEGGDIEQTIKQQHIEEIEVRDVDTKLLECPRTYVTEHKRKTITSVKPPEGSF